MVINRKELDDLSLLLTISINESDYKDKVEKNLWNYKKKTQFPGFRKGKVPYKIISNQYYKILVNEEINKLVYKSLNEYIIKENLQILGSPLLINNKEKFTKDICKKNFFFKFKLGLIPNFDINLDKIFLNYYNIYIKEEDLNNQIKKLQNYFGKFLYKEFISKTDYIEGNIIFYNYKKKIEKKYSFFLNDLSKNTIKKFLNFKIGNYIKINTSELFLNKEKWDSFNQELEISHFQTYFIIKKIFEIQPSNLDQNFFDKVLGLGIVKSLQEFRQKIKEKLLEFYKFKSDNFFLQSFFNYLYNNIHFNLPYIFLRHLIKYSQKEILLEDQLLKKYKQYEKVLRRELFEKKLIKKLEIKINSNKIRNFTSSFLEDKIDKKKVTINQLIDNILQDKKKKNQMYNLFFRDCLIKNLKKKIQLKNKNISWSNFLNIIKKNKY